MISACARGGMPWVSHACVVARLFSSGPAIFDARLKLAQRTAAARMSAAGPGGGTSYEYIREAVAARLVDRLCDIKRSFPTALELGADGSAVGDALSAARAASEADGGPDGAGGVRTLHVVDGCEPRLLRGAGGWAARRGLATVPVVWPADGSARLPFADGSVDLVLSSCALHWASDLAGAFAEARRVLRPDGAFLGALLGGETLAELRSAFVAAQSEREGGVSPHVSPMAGVTDVGNALAAAGLGMPTVDAEPLRVAYPDALRLCEHLQAMGESGAAAARRPAGRRDTMLAMAAAYQALYPAPPDSDDDDDGARAGARAGAGGGDAGIVATFDVVYFIAWAPDASQPKPLRRGSVPKGLGARGTGPPPEAN
jgi:NADH dehydrogenase [ubiquinone] 1 alpha subcomplex assembly factor 5